MNKLILFLLVCMTVQCSGSGQVGWRLPAEVLQNPTNTICKSLWSVEGSRCNGDALLKYSQMDQDSLNKEVLLYHDTVDRISQIVSDPKSILNQVNHRSFHFLDIFKDARAVAGMKKSVYQCAQHLKAVRSASLCFVCANSYQIYFLQDKGLITGGDCKKMVQECFPFFHDTMRVVKKLVKLSKRKESDLTCKSLGGFKTAFSRLEERIEQAQIRDILTPYETVRSFNTAKVILSRPICTRLFMLNKAPIIRAFRDLLYFILYNKELLGNLQTNMVKKKQERLAKKSKLSFPESSSRKLKAQKDFADLPWDKQTFVGDVAVLSEDEKADSYVVWDKGTLESQVNSGIKPMNLSLAFP